MTFRSFVLAIMLTLLVGGVSLANQPDNYCTTVDVVAANGAYNVNATGAGRYARIRDLTDNVTVIATDFGAGATAYAWTGVTLNTAHNYQVQVSHTSLTTGYSTSGCTFTPPIPQAVTIDRFEIVNGAFEWDSIQDGAGYWVEYRGRPVTAWTPAQSPGNWGWFSYRVRPLVTSARAFPFGVYDLWAQDVTGQVDKVATYTYEEVKPGK